jgi:cobyrinic acid a,c-diamide synthase
LFLGHEFMHPRIVIAGVGGDCGKTLASIGLAAAWRREGRIVVPFKKGPDYIDAAWLSLACGRSARNLDSWMMGPERVAASFAANAVNGGLHLIEGNRGLYDGEDARGTHSTAELAKQLSSPVVLVLSVSKMTRTAAAIALGMKRMDPALNIGGVLLNRIATTRQESIIRAAIESEAGISVLGAIPRSDESLLPGRHLGLITPEEHAYAERAVNAAADLVGRSVDLKKLEAIAETAAQTPIAATAGKARLSAAADGHGLKIGFFKSSAFTFYYPENLEAIESTGAKLIAVDPLHDAALPSLDALYIGGGFPETHAAQLAGNESFRASVAEAVRRGLPIWAECGGLMFLARSIYWKESSFSMAGVLPVEVVLGNKPEGHGYEEVEADRPNAFVPAGTVLRGHEFHYSRVVGAEHLETAFEVKRGTALGNGRDGIVMNRVLASYMHAHSTALPDWANWLVDAARAYHRERNPTWVGGAA